MLLIIRHPRIIHFVVIVKIQVRISFSSIITNQFTLLDDLLNDNTNMSTVSLSSKIDYLSLLFSSFFSSLLATIVNAALQSNTSRLRLDWPDNVRAFFLYFQSSIDFVYLDVGFVVW
jgi:hypothetical protein